MTEPSGLAPLQSAGAFAGSGRQSIAGDSSCASRATDCNASSLRCVLPAQVLVRDLRSAGCFADPRSSWGMALALRAGRVSQKEVNELAALQWASGAEVVHSLQVYTDGPPELCKAWPRISAVASFAFVAFADTDKGNMLVGAWSAPFDSDVWAAAPTSAAAELAAIDVAARYVAQFPGLPVAFRSDCKYALEVAFGLCRARAHLVLASSCRWDFLLSVSIAISAAHVKGHSGIGGNTLADVAAWSALGAAAMCSACCG